jgi:hypothetical protein
MKNSTFKTSNFLKIALVTLLMGATTLLNAQSTDTVYAEIAAIDQPFMYNRMGAAQPTGMIFALMSDLEGDTTTPGKARLRADKRPRPIVIRANKGNVVIVRLKNLLTPYDANGIVDAYFPATQAQYPDTVTQSMAEVNYPRTRAVGFHAEGMEMGTNISDDGSFNGANPTSLTYPIANVSLGHKQTQVYTIIAAEEGAFMLYSTGADFDQNPAPRGGQLTSGLFGTLSVQPEMAEWYRSQVTEADLDKAIKHWEIPNDNPSVPNTIILKSSASDPYSLDGAFPIINYNKKDKDSIPILKMYTQTRPHFRTLVHTDLTAIITGPNAGRFPYAEDDPAFFNVPASPDRRQPYREFAIHYHEALYAVQAFPIFYKNIGLLPTDDVTGTLVAGDDSFAINYGTGGIGAEIFANRIKVGPMADCADCAYEEFFLSSWAVGDPATIVDIPANANVNTAGNLIPDTTLQNQFLLLTDPTKAEAKLDETPVRAKATKVLYPDDPSNVYHSYMNDHVKFRITHAGAGITHVHHQHAHQWLHSPNSDDGHYMDSQTINPGSSYTLEMVYNGSGNLNKTVGDQIFHCHFYPHFAAGMWSMWRVHDVLELGTELDGNNIPKSGARAYPDGEIDKGTAIPGLVPMPTIGMAPMPGKVHIDEGQVVVDDDTKSPGYPFYIPGIAGSRPPHPPLDFATGTIYNESGDSTGVGPLNGGLPRNVILKANVAYENHNQFDWTKIIDEIEIIELPEDGTIIEKLAMKEHATRTRPSLTPGGRQASFTLNGQPPVSGAPFANPAVDLYGNPVGVKRTYKAAVIQLDVVLNKKGWHYPQQRMISLWGDVSANISGEKAPEPFFFRANTGEFVEFWHTNLVPQYYELDDYQVRTPTDVIGQHIHLVKFDVTSSDGAANGFNYEDGTLAPDLVTERIDAINNGGKFNKYNYTSGQPITTSYTNIDTTLTAYYPNPIWGPAPKGQNWRGAQTTIQRWYADPLLNNKGEDRTVRTVFTHDHFGPSTHQQIGLYAGLLVEPNKSKWLNPIKGDQYGVANNGVRRPVNVNGATKHVSDGGPTGWQANIITLNEEDSYREFMLEFQDNQQAYFADSKDTLDPYPHYPGTTTKSFTDSVTAYTGWMDPTNAINAPGAPQLISSGGKGTYSVNYRNEPIPLRVSNNGTQPTNLGGNLAYAFSSSLTRSDASFNTQPVGGSLIDTNTTFKYPVQPIAAGMNPTDPYTPLFRAYENDKIQVRTLVGAHVTSHFFNIHGAKWFFEPSNKNSGYRSTQNMGLSEHFEMNFQLPTTDSTARDSSFTDYLYIPSADMNGLQAGLWGLMRGYDSEQSNIQKLPNNDISDPESEKIGCGCPAGATVQEYNVTAINIGQYNNPNGLIYNQRYNNNDATAMVFVRNKDLNKFKTQADWEVEPLVLRANAGSCVKVNLTNGLLAGFPVSSGTYAYGTESVTLNPSSNVGLHAELLSYDVGKSDGSNVGFNSTTQTPATGKTTTYEWYAGMWTEDNKPVPVEFGSVVLTAPDPLEQYVAGLFGALIIEPEGATWKEDANSPSSANVYDANGNLLFREFVLQFQDNLTVQSVPQGNNPNQYATITNAINYKSEPLDSRFGDTTNTAIQFNSVDVSAATSNTMTNNAYPETPHLVAQKGTPIRLRLLHAGGAGTGEIFELHGHNWQEEPYTDDSKKIGNNEKSQWFGYRDQLGALNSFDLPISSAGGRNEIPGDYLYRSMSNTTFKAGVWGMFSVTNSNDLVYLTAADNANKLITISGGCTVDPVTGKLPTSITLKYGKAGSNTATVDKNGLWSFTNLPAKNFKKVKGATLTSSTGGVLTLDRKQLSGLDEAPVYLSTKPSGDVQTREEDVELGRGVKATRTEGPQSKMK